MENNNNYKNQDNSEYTPIGLLYADMQEDYKIKGRVTHKSDIRTYKN